MADDRPEKILAALGGAGNLTEDAVRGMLGTIDQRHLVRLIDAQHWRPAHYLAAVASFWLGEFEQFE